MRIRNSWGFSAAMILMITGMIWFPSSASAEIITFSGTITYSGAYSGDTLFVGVLDTAGVSEVQDVNLVTVGAFAPGASPFSQAYSLNFENTGLPPTLMVASFLDVDGGGVDTVSGSDVFGWYAGGPGPALVSSVASQSGLDFALPLAEIRGTITFASEQNDARVEVFESASCAGFRLRPETFATGPGPYAVIGVYPGTFCVSASGYFSSGFFRVCHGDPSCGSPTFVTVSGAEVITGVDLDFSGIVPVQATTWGRVKARYP